MSGDSMDAAKKKKVVYPYSYHLLTHPETSMRKGPSTNMHEHLEIMSLDFPGFQWICQ